jgi:hypothetical protein
MHAARWHPSASPPQGPRHDTPARVERLAWPRGCERLGPPEGSAQRCVLPAETAHGRGAAPQLCATPRNALTTQGARTRGTLTRARRYPSGRPFCTGPPLMHVMRCQHLQRAAPAPAARGLPAGRLVWTRSDDAWRCGGGLQDFGRAASDLPDRTCVSDSFRVPHVRQWTAHRIRILQKGLHTEAARTPSHDQRSCSERLPAHTTARQVHPAAVASPAHHSRLAQQLDLPPTPTGTRS